jgi:hypothetical protein
VYALPLIRRLLRTFFVVPYVCGRKTTVGPAKFCWYNIQERNEISQKSLKKSKVVQDLNCRYQMLTIKFLPHSGGKKLFLNCYLSKNNPLLTAYSTVPIEIPFVQMCACTVYRMLSGQPSSFSTKHFIHRATLFELSRF